MKTERCLQSIWKPTKEGGVYLDKDYDNFVQRMGSFEMELELDDSKPKPELELQHFGVKGMKWGVRKPIGSDGLVKGSKAKTDKKSKSSSKSESTNTSKSKSKSKSKSESTSETKDRTITTKDGSKLSLSKDKTPALAKAIAKLSPKIRQLIEDTENLTIKDPDGKTVGEMQLYKEKKDSLNVVWVGINDSERGKGYATAAMNSAVKFAKENNMKQVTLEVPGDSPDALHIYEKMGFKKGKTLSEDDVVWGGLTEMTLKLDDDKIKHYGVLGMKWGVRRAVGSDGRVVKSGKGTSKSTPESTDTNTQVTGRQVLKKSKNAKNLSDDELKEYVDRLTLENKLKQLSKETKTRISSKERQAMTNDDIKEVNKRLQLEANLSKQVKEATKTQRILAEHALAAVGKMVVSEGSRSIVDVGLDTLIDISDDNRLRKKG